MDEDLEQRYVEEAVGAVGALAQRFRGEPASFLSESDLQALLFADLFERLRAMKLEGSAGELGFEKARVESLRLNPVKTEYHYDHTPRSDLRFDIALLGRLNRPNKHVWSQWVVVGVELKLRPPYGRAATIEDDVSKLKSYRDFARQNGRPFTGLALLFCHRHDDEVLADVNRAGRVVPPGEPIVPARGDVTAWAFTP